MRDEHRRPRVDDGDDRRARLGGGDDARQVERRRGRRVERILRQHLGRVEVDAEDAARRRDAGDHRDAEHRADDRGRVPGRGGRRRADRAGGDVGDRERVAGAGRLGRERERGHLLGAAVDVERRAARAVRDDDLGHEQRRRVAEHLRLLVVQLQHRHVPEHVAVEVGVLARARRSRARARAPGRRRRAAGRARARRASRSGSRSARAGRRAPSSRPRAGRARRRASTGRRRASIRI